MRLFQNALFLVTKFPKIVLKNSIFPLNFHQKLSKFSQNFLTICVFRPTARKLTHGLLNLLKIMLTSCILNDFLKKSFENLRKFSCPGAPAPGPPRGRPPNVFHLTEILATPLHEYLNSDKDKRCHVMQ